MSSSSSDNELPKEDEVVKRKVGRPVGSGRTALWRYRENGTYSHECLDPEYAKKYYREHLMYKVCCPLCSRNVGVQKLSRHQGTALCKKNRKDDNIV